MGQFNPDTDENILGITDKRLLNEEEAKGIIRAEEYLLELDTDTIIDAAFILKLHKVAFWASLRMGGKVENN